MNGIRVEIVASSWIDALGGVMGLATDRARIQSDELGGVIYIDHESFFIVYTDLYDRGGELSGSDSLPVRRDHDVAISSCRGHDIARAVPACEFHFGSL